MLKLATTFITFLVAYGIIFSQLLLNISISVKKEGYFDPNYSQSSYKIRTNLKSADKKREWFEFYTRSKKVDVNDKLEFESPEYTFQLQDNYSTLKKVNNVNNLEKIDDPFVKEVIYLLKCGRSLRFKIRERILILYSNDFCSPFEVFYLKKNFKHFNTITEQEFEEEFENLSFKKNHKINDIEELNEIEKFIIHLSLNIRDFPKNYESLDSLIRYVELDVITFKITYKNNKIVVWNDGEVFLVINVRDKKISNILNEFVKSYPALERLKKLLMGNALLCYCKKDRFIIRCFNESNVSTYVLEFDVSEVNEKNTAVKELYEYLKNEGVIYDFKLTGSSGSLIKLLKKFKKYKINGEEEFFK